MNNNNESFTPVIVFNNADTNKVMVLKNNKGKARMYQRTHKELRIFYIGSAFNLEKRLNSYYSLSYLNCYNICISIMLYRSMDILHLLCLFLKDINILNLT